MTERFKPRERRDLEARRLDLHHAAGKITKAREKLMDAARLIERAAPEAHRRLMLAVDSCDDATADVHGQTFVTTSRQKQNDPPAKPSSIASYRARRRAGR